MPIKKQILCAAAVMAHTNLGCECPTKEKVQSLLGRDTETRSLDLTSYVEAISGYLFENQEMADMFLDEAKGWIGVVSKPEFLEPWPEKAELFE